MNLPARATSYAAMLATTDAECARMNHWLTPADAAAAVLKALATERAVQARCEETLAIVRDAPWKIGGVGAQEAAFVRATDDRAASVEREAALLAMERGGRRDQDQIRISSQRKENRATPCVPSLA